MRYARALPPTKDFVGQVQVTHQYLKTQKPKCCLDSSNAMTKGKPRIHQFTPAACAWQQVDLSVGNRYSNQFESQTDKALPIFAIVCTMCTGTEDNHLLEKFDMTPAVHDGKFEAISFLPLEKN